MSLIAFYALVLLVTYGWTSSNLFIRARITWGSWTPAQLWPLAWCPVCVGTWVTVALFWLLKPEGFEPTFVATAIHVAYYVVGVHAVQQLRPKFLASPTIEEEHEIVRERHDE